MTHFLANSKSLVSQLPESGQPRRVQAFAIPWNPSTALAVS